MINYSIFYDNTLQYQYVADGLYFLLTLYCRIDKVKYTLDTKIENAKENLN